jgi:hypothetical protein
MYELVRTGQYYAIVCDGQPVRSPLGKPYLTGYRLLAEDLCEDLKRFGLCGSGTISVLTLHDAYLDYGANVPRAQLESELLTRYDPATDFALDRPKDRTAEAVMTTWFGPAAPPEALSAWLRAASVRRLVSMVVAADVTDSVLVAHRLLRSELPAGRLAAGVRKWDRGWGHPVSELTLILEKIRRYAQVPEEMDLLTGIQIELEASSKGSVPK